jgi:hypothetical protein
MDKSKRNEPSVKPKQKAKANRVKVPAPKPAPKKRVVKKKTNQKKSPPDPLSHAMSRLAIKSEPTSVSQWKSAGGGATGSTKELLIRYTDYFRTIDVNEDPDAPEGRMITYMLDPKSHFVDATAGDTWSITTGARVHQVTAYAQEPFIAGEKFDAGVNTKIVLFGIPASNASGAGSCVAQQSTEIRASADPKWVKIGHWSATKTFGTSMLQPQTISGSDVICLAKIEVTNALNMGPSDQALVIRLDYEMLETLPEVTVQKIFIKRDTASDFWVTLPGGTPEYTDVIADIVDCRDAL